MAFELYNVESCQYTMYYYVWHLNYTTLSHANIQCIIMYGIWTIQVESCQYTMYYYVWHLNYTTLSHANIQCIIMYGICSQLILLHVQPFVSTYFYYRILLHMYIRTNKFKNLVISSPRDDLHINIHVVWLIKIQNWAVHMLQPTLPSN